MPRKHDRTFDDFAVGDRVSFTRRFAAKDFKAFATLSGDRNPLHHDRTYAAESGFDQPILPLHLTAAPLSAVAGMVLPGHRSLYLQQNLRALAPAAYDRDITYSAKIVAKNAAAQSLSLRVLALDEAEILLEADLLVQVRADAPAVLAPARSDATPIERPGRPCALVTGATGAIGRAICRALARAGHDLVLVHRGRNEDAKALAQTCKAEGAKVSQVSADLAETAACNRLARRLAKSDQVDLLVHCASPGVQAAAGPLLAVNHQALTTLAAALLPAWLRRQSGGIVLIGSSAVQHSPAGWESYVAAKTAASQWVTTFHDRYTPYGLAGWVVAPSYVRSEFSEGLRPDGAAILLPEQVAETVAGCVTQSTAPPDTYVWLTPAGERRGRFGFFGGNRSNQTDGTEDPAAPKTEIAAAQATPKGNGTLPVADLVRDFLGAAPDSDLSNAGVDLFPGWDSLKHIELMLHLERSLGIAFSSTEIERTARFADLCALLDEKTTDRGAGRS